MFLGNEISALKISEFWPYALEEAQSLEKGERVFLTSKIAQS